MASSFPSPGIPAGSGGAFFLREGIALFPIRTEFDRVFAFTWLTGGAGAIPVIRTELRHSP